MDTQKVSQKGHAKMVLEQVYFGAKCVEIQEWLIFFGNMYFNSYFEVLVCIDFKISFCTRINQSFHSLLHIFLEIHSFFFKIWCFLFLFLKGRFAEKRKDRSPFHWFSPKGCKDQSLADSNQELGASSGPLTWGQEPKGLSFPMLLFLGHSLAAGLKVKKLGHKLLAKLYVNTTGRGLLCCATALALNILVSLLIENLTCIKKQW